MKINIEGDYYITSDKYNIILSKLKRDKDKNIVTVTNKEGTAEVMDAVFFCPSVGFALNEYFNMKERTSKVTTFDGLMKLITANNKLMKEILEKLDRK